MARYDLPILQTSPGAYEVKAEKKDAPAAGRPPLDGLYIRIDVPEADKGKAAELIRGLAFENLNPFSQKMLASKGFACLSLADLLKLKKAK